MPYIRAVSVDGKWKTTHLRRNEGKIEVKWRVSNTQGQKFGISVVGKLDSSRIRAPGVQHGISDPGVKGQIFYTLLLNLHHY